MGVRRGGTGIPPLEIETKHQDSPENMKLVAQFRSIEFLQVHNALCGCYGKNNKSMVPNVSQLLTKTKT